MEPEIRPVCQYCAILVPQRGPLEPRHQTGFHSLGQSIRHRCGFCNALAVHLKPGWQEFWRPSTVQTFEEFIEKLLVRPSVTDVKISPDGDVSWGTWSYSLQAPSPLTSIAHGDISSRFHIQTCESPSPIASQPGWTKFPTSIPDKFATIYSWFHECNRYHYECVVTGIEPPTRLIQVPPEYGLNPKLVETSTLDPSTIRYCTLSYRWGERGGNTQPRTTNANFADYLKSIDYESLPRTHKDALAICLYLHIDYLWIDALCIIDDPQDWALEAARMKDVYAGSVMTIAANDALDSYGGFFAGASLNSPERYAAMSGRSFFAVPKPGEEANGEITKRLVQLEDRGHSQRSALAERGWTLQEIILSRRVVLVSNSELTWRCRRSLRTETGLYSRLPPDFLKCDPLVIPGHLNELEMTANAWWSWMQDFSAREFSFPAKDRLAALAGVVDYYAQHSGDTPLLGLWKNTLHEDLQWMRSGPSLKMDDQIFQNIPSWSWLSCRGIVMFEPWFQRPMFGSIPQNHIEVDKSNSMVKWTDTPFVSKVKSSQLIVNAPMKELYVTLNEMENFIVSEVGVAEQTESSTSLATIIFDDGQEDNYISKTYLCLLARSQTSEMSPTECVNVFIIFEPAPGPVEGKSFRRIGIGSYWNSAFNFDLKDKRSIHWI